MKTNYLEAELARTSKGWRSSSTIKGKPPRSMHDPPVIRKIHGSSKVENEACLQKYNFGFIVCELIMQDHFPKIGGATEPLILWNATPEEIVSAVECRKEGLKKALGLINFVLPPSSSKK